MSNMIGDDGPTLEEVVQIGIVVVVVVLVLILLALETGAHL